MATATPRLMGAEVKRKEDPRLVTGASAYVGDITRAGMQYVAFVRSPHAHATTARWKPRRPRARVARHHGQTQAHCQPIPLGGPAPRAVA